MRGAGRSHMRTGFRSRFPHLTGKYTGSFVVSGHSATRKAQQLTALQAFLPISRRFFCKENNLQAGNHDRISAWICASQRRSSAWPFGHFRCRPICCESISGWFNGDAGRHRHGWFVLPKSTPI